jgi:hypothetical protein
MGSLRCLSRLIASWEIAKRSEYGSNSAPEAGSGKFEGRRRNHAVEDGNAWRADITVRRHLLLQAPSDSHFYFNY